MDRSVKISEGRCKLHSMFAVIILSGYKIVPIYLFIYLFDLIIIMLVLSLSTALQFDLCYILHSKDDIPQRFTV
jgi:hypothetical protein